MGKFRKLIMLLIMSLLLGCVANPPGLLQPGLAQPSQTIEFYNSDGTRAGYGKAGPGGSVEFFNPNSTRGGFGKTGR